MSARQLCGAMVAAGTCDHPATTLVDGRPRCDKHTPCNCYGGPGLGHLLDCPHWRPAGPYPAPMHGPGTNPTDRTRTTIGVPYTASVATVRGGGVALTLTCGHCGDECPLDVEGEQLDAVASMRALDALDAPPAAATKLRAIALARAAAALPECVRVAVWLLTHTTGHHETMLREVARD